MAEKKYVKHYPERLSRDHIPEIAEIEKLCFAAAAWSEKSLEYLINDNIGVGFVCKDGGEVCAYGGMLCVCGEGQITNIATHPDHRRMGYAYAVLSALIKYAKDNRFDNITLEVRESNKAAIALYVGCGFKVVGNRKNFYTRPDENGLIMELKLK